MKKMIEIKEDVRIGDVILEAGDKIRVLKELQKEYFQNEFPLSIDNAKRLSTNYQSPWIKNNNEWTMYISGRHVMVYLPREGKLFTDLTMTDVNNIINK